MESAPSHREAGRRKGSRFLLLMLEDEWRSPAMTCTHTTNEPSLGVAAGPVLEAHVQISALFSYSRSFDNNACDSSYSTKYDVGLECYFYYRTIDNVG